MHSIAFATGEIGSFFAAILAYQGVPDSQPGVITVGMSKGCVMASGKHPLAIDSGGTSLGASCPTPHCWCFGWTWLGMCSSRSDQAVCLSIVNGHMKCPDGSESGKVSRGFCQVWTVLLASLASFYGLWIQLEYHAMVPWETTVPVDS